MSDKRPEPIRHPVGDPQPMIDPDLAVWRAEFRKWQDGQKQGVKPSVILAVVAWTLFFLLGLGMALGRIDVTWFGVTFIVLCFLVGGVTSMSISGSKKP